MEKLKHTPGPWVTYDDDITQVIASDKDRTLRMGCVFHDSKNLDVVQANARLIAAAPDMLKALVNEYRGICLTSNCPSDEPCYGEPKGRCGEEMRIAIERATGMTIEEVLK